MPRYVCVHGHFYQPPRENAWLEAVERQESAYPDHDWNQHITRECYAPNAKARLLDSNGRIVKLVSNYARMSFNFGPTLLAWMKDSSPRAYAEILAGDAASRERFDGHGSAMAQGYNHTILPLSNDRDRRTQVRWGVRDFESRFGRRPEGLWLPETAVNTDSLEALAAEGIRFTVLAPRQCRAVREIGSDQWSDVQDAVDPTQPYICRLPSGRSITLFFYDGPISQAVAFEGLLNNGDRFAGRLLEGFDDARDHPQLMHIATDGESYGHHHQHGEMALAAALEAIERREDVQLINYALFLQRHPPTMEAQIHENSSWSCVHGVERWRSDCGCNSGRQGFHQRWREPLRNALDWLRDAVAPAFESRGRELFKDPWLARDAYIDVVLDRSPESLERFFGAQASHPLSEAEKTDALRLMELQRHAMLMYTSCAWFFDDVAGIETVQVIQYAGRVVQLARLAIGADLEAELLNRLAAAKGSTREMPDARAVFEKAVRPAMLDLHRVGAHYALGRTFDGDTASINAFEVLDPEVSRRTAGRTRLLLGHATFRSRITLDHAPLSFAVLHLGDHTTSCAVRDFVGPEAFTRTVEAAGDAFDRADFAEVLRVFDREFAGTHYGLASLFRDEQHAVVRRILEPTLKQIDASYSQIYEQHAPMARFLRSLSLTVPRRIQMVGSHVLTQALRHILESHQPDLVRAREILEESVREGITLDHATLTHAALDALGHVADLPLDSLHDPATLRAMLELTTLVRVMPFTVDLWRLQQAFFDRVIPLRDEMNARASSGDPRAAGWPDLYSKLADALEIVS